MWRGGEAIRIKAMDTPQKRGGEAGRNGPKYHYGDPLYRGLFTWPKPRMDWDKMRLWKAHQCVSCPYYDCLLDGCRIGFTLDNTASRKV
jgi:hypothetical protein